MSGPNTNGTALAKRENGRGVTKEQRNELRAELSRYSESFAKVLPKTFTPERLITLTLVAATKTPQLFDCSPESIALSVVRVAQWGLEIGTTAHLVPFKGQCTPIADYKGLIQLMIRSGHVRDVKAYAVYKNEHFRVTAGAHPVLEHDPIMTESARGPLVAAYAVAWLRGGHPTWEVMARDEIEAIRKRARSGNSEAWREHYDEMAKKTAIRRLAKRMPQSTELADALGVEDDDAAPLPKGEVWIVEPETPAALMPGRETALQDRARTVSSAEYGGSSDDAPLSPDAMLAAEDPYAEQDDRWIAAQDGELALGETRARSRTAQEEGR